MISDRQIRGLRQQLRSPEVLARLETWTDRSAVARITIRRHNEAVAELTEHGVPLEATDNDST
jgi:hypothetical protein